MHRHINVAKLVKAGADPALVWGSSIMGWCPSVLHKHRSRVARSSCNIPMGAHAATYLRCMPAYRKVAVCTRHDSEVVV
eukprot:3324344-Amphidinium_carterae.3